jgi:hypothetical protein
MIGTTSEKAGNVTDKDYRSFLTRFEDDVLGSGDSPLFTTDAEGLWDAYLASFPDDERQFHNCNSCRHFIERYGGLVRLAEDGLTLTALWHGAPSDPTYQAGFYAMRSIVKRARVTGVLLSKEPVLGHPITGVWRHFSLKTPAACRAKAGLLTPFQQMAEKREDHHNVMRALAEFTAPMVDQALTLLKSEALYRSEKVLGPAQWLADLHAACAAAEGRRSNVVWRAVATAPSGFCHPRSSMIGTLLEDIAAGKPFDDVARAFKAKMHPLQYQRPQAAPSAGNIAQAEKLVAELGIANSLKRRYARLEEIETIWRPAAEAKPEGGGVFGHLKPKGAQSAEPMTTAPQAITWEKFVRTVLPEAKALELLVPSLGNFAALLTAEDPEAPPILQWDSAERRNPFSWYLYHGGSMASRWGLSAGWARVVAVTLQPNLWHGAKFEHQGAGALFVLPGAKDGNAARAGCGLFPEILKSELREVRSTIEAFSRRATPSGAEEASANGYIIQKNNADATVRAVLGNGMRMGYRIDRWD